MGDEATLDVWGTFSREAIRVLILFAAQQDRASHQRTVRNCREGRGDRLPIAGIFPIQ
jgi:hypothetical protein